MNDSNFGFQEQTLGLRQGTAPPTKEPPSALEDNHGLQLSVSNPIRDLGSHVEPILAFHSCLKSDGDRAKVGLDDKLLRIEAQIGGRIKIPEQTPGSNFPEVGELTFYRRNLFKVSVRVYLLQEGATKLLQLGVVRLVARLDAIESIEGETVKLIRLPIKNDGLEDSASAKGEPVQSVLLDHRAADASGQATLDMCWDRLQFRRATTKTRGSVAQRYRLRVTVVATTTKDASEKILGQVASEPIVVRGRSPKNYPDQAKGQYFSVKTAKTGRSASIRGESIPQTVSPSLQEGSTEPGTVLTTTNSRTDAEFLSKKLTTALPPKPMDQGQIKTTGNIDTTDLDLYSDASEGSSPPEMPSATLTRHNTLPLNVNIPIQPVGHQPASAYPWLERRKTEPSPGGILLPSLRRQSIKVAALDSAPTASADAEGDSYEYIPLSINDWSAPVDPVYVSLTDYCSACSTQPAKANVHFPAEASWGASQSSQGSVWSICCQEAILYRPQVGGVRRTSQLLLRSLVVPLESD